MQQLDLFAMAIQTSAVTEKQPANVLPVVDAVVEIPPTPVEKPQENLLLPNAPIIKYQKKSLKKIIVKRGRKSYKEMQDDIVMVEIPADEILYQKQYYAISEVAEWFHVNTSLIRFWENEFDILKPRKNRKGDRLFRPEDIKNLQLIYHLLRLRKYSIEGAKQFLKDNKEQADANMQLIFSLTKFRAFLLELRANLGA